MNVTIIGAGNMGRGIGHRLVAGGHEVTVVDRDPEEAGRLAEELRGADSFASRAAGRSEPNLPSPRPLVRLFAPEPRRPGSCFGKRQAASGQ